jgi:hypothetical protein
MSCYHVVLSDSQWKESRRVFLLSDDEVVPDPSKRVIPSEYPCSPSETDCQLSPNNTIFCETTSKNIGPLIKPNEERQFFQDLNTLTKDSSDPKQ